MVDTVMVPIRVDMVQEMVQESFGHIDRETALKMIETVDLAYADAEFTEELIKRLVMSMKDEFIAEDDMETRQAYDQAYNKLKEFWGD